MQCFKKFPLFVQCVIRNP
uniref:Uncharacterized protein n=1 Tax=Anguilla anguilla TaxID=7936 RepID=A0A0E9S001_ANGAN